MSPLLTATVVNSNVSDTVVSLGDCTEPKPIPDGLLFVFCGHIIELLVCTVSDSLGAASKSVSKNCDSGGGNVCSVMAAEVKDCMWSTTNSIESMLHSVRAEGNNPPAAAG